MTREGAATPGRGAIPRRCGVWSSAQARLPHTTSHDILLAYCAPSPPRLHAGSFAHASRSDGQRNLVELQALHPSQPSARFCIAIARFSVQAGLWIIATQPARNARARRDLCPRLYVAAIAYPHPPRTHAPRSHTQTGSWARPGDRRCIIHSFIHSLLVNKLPSFSSFSTTTTTFSSTDSHPAIFSELERRCAAPEPYMFICEYIYIYTYMYIHICKNIFSAN